MTARNETPEYGRSGWLLVGSFLCGALTGGALAMLLASERGRETRVRLAAKVREGQEQASEAWERGKEAFGRTRDHLKDQRGHASRVVKEGGAALSDIRERGERALENIRQEATEAIADAKAAFKGACAEVRDQGD